VKFSAPVGGASGAVCEYFSTLYSDGFSPKHILAIVQAVLDLRTSVEPLSHILEVIVSGPTCRVYPSVTRSPRCTPWCRVPHER
jgi:hypothetical protein